MTHRTDAPSQAISLCEYSPYHRHMVSEGLISHHMTASCRPRLYARNRDGPHIYSWAIYMDSDCFCFSAIHRHASYMVFQYRISSKLSGCLNLPGQIQIRRHMDLLYNVSRLCHFLRQIYKAALLLLLCRSLPICCHHLRVSSSYARSDPSH